MKTRKHYLIVAIVTGILCVPVLGEVELPLPEDRQPILIGKGKLFYFRPDHENFNVFHQPEPLKNIANAARWLGNGIAKHKSRQ